MPVNSIDRAHRIGLRKKNDDGVEVQPIIVRFTSFRDRTIVYKARKDVKRKLNYGISVDLTKKKTCSFKKMRGRLLKMPRNPVTIMLTLCTVILIVICGLSLRIVSICHLIPFTT